METTNGAVNRKLRMGLVGGGQGAFIGRVHATAAVLDNRANLVAGALAVDSTAATKRACPVEHADSARRNPHAAEASASKDEQMDLVSFADPNDTHFQMAEEVENNVSVECASWSECGPSPVPVQFSSGGLLAMSMDASAPIDTRRAIGHAPDLRFRYCTRPLSIGRAISVPELAITLCNPTDLSNRRSFDFRLDSGADFTVVDYRMAFALGYQLEHARRESVNLVDGTQIDVALVVASLRLVDSDQQSVSWMATIGFGNVRRPLFGWTDCMELFDIQLLGDRFVLQPRTPFRGFIGQLPA